MKFRILATCLLSACCVFGDENLIVNGDFEAAGYTANYKENCGSAYLIGWTCSQAGIATPQGTYLSKAIQAYDNTAWAFLKKASWFAQDVVIATPGDYRLEFDYCGRPGDYIKYADTIITFGDQTVDEIVGEGATENGSKIERKSYDITVGTPGTYTLKFEQKITGDRSPAFDNISLTALTTPDHIQVVGIPDRIGTPSPAYGKFAMTAGSELACAMTGDLTVPGTDGIRYLFAGWALSVKASDGSESAQEGETTSVAFTPASGDFAKLEWRWTTQYKTTATAVTGGSVGTSEQWTSAGGDATVTATPAEGYLFYKWTGDVPADKARMNPLVLSAEAPCAVTATFRPKVTKTVNADGTGDYATIGAAVTEMNKLTDVLGELVLEPGVYALQDVVHVTAPMTIRSSTGNPDDVLVWADRGTSEERWRPKRGAFSLEHDDALLYGISISNAYSSANTVGGAVAMTSAATIDHCKLAGNLGYVAAANIPAGGVIRDTLVCDNTGVSSGRTGGLYLAGGTVENCTIINNKGEYSNSGVGVNTDGGVIRGCVITNNFNSFGLYAQGAGGIHVASGTVTIERTLIAGNTSGFPASDGNPGGYGSSAGGIYINNNASVTIRRCTVAGNMGGEFGGICRWATAVPVKIEDSIVWGNLDNGFAYALTGGAKDAKKDANVARLADESLIHSCTTIDFGGSNMTCDPIFVDADRGDYRLAANSPCLGMGWTDDVGPAVVVPELQDLVEVKPGDDLRAKVALSAAGGTVRISDGDYPVSKLIAVTRPVRIESVNGPDKTSVYATEENQRVFNLNCAGSVLSGLTVSNVTFTKLAPATVAFVREGTITNCVFTKNTNKIGSYGGGFVEGYNFKMLDSKLVGNYGGGGHRGSGVMMTGPNCLLQGCEIANNTHREANAGGSQVVLNGGTINRCVITNNYGTGGSIGVTVAGGTGQVVQNTLIAKNKSPYSLCPTCGIYINTTGVRLENCTIVGNEGTKSAGLQLNGKNVACKNVIAWGNTATAGSAEAPNVYNATAATFKNCFFELATECSAANFTDCQSGEPDFTDYGGNDYTLKSSSPCRNHVATDVAWVEEPALDLAGKGRVNEDIADVGAYEFYAPPGLNCGYKVSGNDIAGGAVTFTATVTGEDQEGLQYRWKLDGNPSEEAGWTEWSSSATLVASDISAGSHTMTLQVKNAAGDSAESNMEGESFAVCCRYLYLVPRHPAGEVAAPPFGTWATAATNIVDLLPFCGDGTDISVADGLHMMTEGVKFTSAVTLHGTNRAETAAFMRDSKATIAHMFNFSVAGSTMSCLSVSNAHCNTTRNFGSGVTIVRGRVENCIIAHGQGCLLGAENSTVINCLVTDSTGGDREPTGFWQRGDEAFASNCVITANRETYYATGAVRIEGGVFTHCQVTKNLMSNGGTEGCGNGGIQLVKGVVAETLIAENTCNEGAAGIQFAPASATDAGVVVNCTIVSNSVNKTAAGGLVLAASGTLYMTNAVFYGNVSRQLDGAKADVTKEWHQTDTGSKLVATHCVFDRVDDLNARAGCSATDCFYADPLFRNASRSDYRVRTSSPCAFAGVGLTDAATDLNGRKRRKLQPTIGCYETGYGLILLVK